MPPKASMQTLLTFREPRRCEQVASQPKCLSALRTLRLVADNAPARLTLLGKFVLGEVVAQEPRSNPQHRSDCRSWPFADLHACLRQSQIFVAFWQNRSSALMPVTLRVNARAAPEGKDKTRSKRATRVHSCLIARSSFHSEIQADR